MDQSYPVQVQARLELSHGRFLRKEVADGR